MMKLWESLLVSVPWGLRHQMSRVYLAEKSNALKLSAKMVWETRWTIVKDFKVHYINLRLQIKIVMTKRHSLSLVFRQVCRSFPIKIGC